MPFPARGEFVKLGKGSLMIDLLDDNGASTGIKFAGNATAVEISSEINQVELYSSTERSAGLVARDKTRISFTLGVTLSEFTIDNLKLFLLGQSATSSQASGTSATKNLDNVVVGDYYEIGHRRITSVVVTDGSQILVLNTDYELNTEYGFIRFLPGGAVVDGEEIVVTYNHPALSLDVIRIGQGPKQIAHILYLSDDANSDGESSKDRLEIWRADIAPEGAMNVISDEYGSFQLTMAILTDGSNHPSDPYGTLTRVAA